MKRTSLRIIKVLGLIICFLAMVASASFYLGYWYYYQYQAERQSIRSLERDFSRLEKKLKQAVKFYPLPLFYLELGRLRLERAMAEIEFGLPEKSEPYLDQAREAIEKAVSGNPLDYSSFWELSKVYFLYNYPLLTYAEKGRMLCREAVKRHPHNEFLNLNVLIIFFEQWPLLEPEEKDWVRSQIAFLQAADFGFVAKLKRKWQQNYRETASIERRLKEIGF
ncbi:MAG: hypothetical protein H5U06_11535 [Candidatus Aminicenantes bacterium]|nr:hypothetical protein [Candidatus Aminicenantes bacterium]